MLMIEVFLNIIQENDLWERQKQKILIQMELLNIGEDIGQEYNPIGGNYIVRIEAGNGCSDTTALNSNGILDSDDGKGAEYTELVDEEGIVYDKFDLRRMKKICYSFRN